MKKLFLRSGVVALIVLIFGCSTSSDGNGNSNMTVVPLAPSNLTGTIVNNQVVLTWNDNSTNETGFKIDRMVGTGSWNINYASVGNNVDTYIDQAISHGNIYTYRLRSFNSIGDSTNSSNEYTINAIVLNLSGPDLTDISGNIYPTVTNGSQTWIAKNLKVTKYSDGTVIPQVVESSQWQDLTTGAWCYYNNSTSNGTTYGKLYNWYAVAGIYNTASLLNPALRKKLAPSGWHIPTDAEWTILTDCLGGENLAGGKMKAIGTMQSNTGIWLSPNTDATNSSGFTGLPGGYRNVEYLFPYYSIGGECSWWSSSEFDITNAYNRTLKLNSGVAFKYNNNKNFGFSVRCVKD